MKSFKSIPGPGGYLALKNLRGSYKLNELHKIGFDLYHKYGPFVRQKILPGLNLLWLYDPNDIATVANDFSKKNFPQRTSHKALIKYRQDRPQIYANSGLIAENGDEWWRLRSALQKNLSRPIYIRQFIESTNEILQEFVESVEQITTTTGEPVDIEPYLANLNLELIVYLTFGFRMGSITTTELSPKSYSSSVVAAAYEANSLTLKLDEQLPIWKLWKTEPYRRYEKCINFLHQEGESLLKQWENLSEEKRARCLMDDYAQDSNLTRKDLSGTAEEYLLAGTDTTSITTAMILYHLSKNPDVQKAILEELNGLMESKEDPTVEIINNKIPYTRAVLKESLRLNPVSIGFARTLPKDQEIRGYLVPKGTIVVTQNFVACRLPENFHNPLEFIPDRWLKESRGNSSIHTHLVLPFGHGMRGCIARRFAEQNMMLVLIKLIRSFNIKWGGTCNEMDIETLLINRPKTPVKLILEKRTAN